MPDSGRTHLSKRKVRAQARACQHALQAVRDSVFRVGKPADRALRGFFRDHREFGSRDRRLINDSIFSVFRWWGWLQQVIESGHWPPPPGLPPRTSGQAAAGAPEASGDAGMPSMNELAKLLLGAALLERHELPPAAEAWADDVECSPDAMSAVVARTSWPLPELGRRVLDLLSGTHSGGTQDPDVTALIPAWTVPLIRCPRGIAELVQWLQRRPPIWIRAHDGSPSEIAADLAAHGIGATAHSCMHSALKIEHTPVNLYGLELFRRGAFEIQDLASQAITLVCAPSAGQRWWDACAGGGGKTLHLAALMQRKGTVVATDLREYKLDDLKRRARRSGLPNIATRRWDGSKPRRRQANFDGVLVDAPCTCSGTWRRHPDARWQISPADLDELSALQARLLANAAAGVKPGGALIYATCSLFEQENQQVVQAFLGAYPRFRLAPFRNPLDGTMTDGTVQTWPWDGDCDAMFAARFRNEAQ